MKNNRQNVLDMVPHINANWEKNPDNIVVLLIPRFNNEFLKKHFLRFLKVKTKTVKLDDYGSFIWQQIDGQKTVYDIGKQLAEHFGESVEPLYERLGMFVNVLAQRQYINLD